MIPRKGVKIYLWKLYQVNFNLFLTSGSLEKEHVVKLKCTENIPARVIANISLNIFSLSRMLFRHFSDVFGVTMWLQGKQKLDAKCFKNHISEKLGIPLLCIRVILISSGR